MKRLLWAVMASSMILASSLPARAYDSTAHANAAIMIIASCTWWQLGKIPRGQIMNFAGEQYRSKYGSDRNINWDKAISIAKQLDRQKNLGCIN